jgi:hypothetical protein
MASAIQSSRVLLGGFLISALHVFTFLFESGVWDGVKQFFKKY